MKYIPAVFISLLFLTAPVMGFEYSGYLQVDYYGNIETTTPYRNDRSRIYLQPKIADRLLDDRFSYTLSANLYWQPLTENEFTPKEFGDPQRIIREAFIGLHLPHIDIFLGHRFVNWGKVDILSPLNLINASDLTVLSLDNSEESSLSDLLAQVQLYITDNIYFDVVYVPFFQPSVLPVDEVDIVIPSSQFQVAAFFRNKKYRMYHDQAHSIHASFNLLSDYIDFTAAYSYYKDQLLDFDLSHLYEFDITDFSTYRVFGKITPGYNYVHNFGLAMSSDFQGVGLSIDGAYRMTKDMNGRRMDIKNNEIVYNVQLDRKFFKILYTQVNFIHRYILDFDKRIQSAYSPPVQEYIKGELDSYLFQKDQSQIYLLLHLDISLVHEKLSLGTNLIYGVAESEFYCAPRLSYKITDRITFFTGADIWIGGSGDGYLSRNKLNDNFNVKFKFAL